MEEYTAENADAVSLAKTGQGLDFWGRATDFLLQRIKKKPRKNWQLKASFPERKKFILKSLESISKNISQSSEDANIKALKATLSLFKKHFELLRRESYLTQELYLQTLAHGLCQKENKSLFDYFISDVQQESELGLQIAMHNFLMEREFKEAGVDWQQWCNFKEQGGAAAVTFVQISDKELKWLELEEDLGQLEILFKPTELAGSVRKDILFIKKEKSKILGGNFPIEEAHWQELLFPKYLQGLAYLKSKGNDFSGFEFPKGADFLQKRVKQIIVELARKSVRHEFLIKLWDREPVFGSDLLQGNFSDCCLAIGTGARPAVHLPGVGFRKYPAGILEFLIDKGIQVAEVIDKDSNAFIGQCWLFVTVDDAQPILVADSFELQRSIIPRGIKKAIRDGMFEFLKKYATACGIKKVVLGSSGPRLKNGKLHIIGNSVAVDDLPAISFDGRLTKKCKAIEKLGGYWNHTPYFLETRGATEAYEIQ